MNGIQTYKPAHPGIEMTNSKLLGFLKLLIPDSDESVSQLAGYFDGRDLKKGEILLKEGEICNSFYFVESGHLCTCHEKEGTDISIEFHLDGSIACDYRNAKAGIPSPFSIKAGEKSRIWIMNMKKLEALCYADERFMVFGRRLVSHMALDLYANSILLKMYSPAERYQYVEENRPELLQRVSLSKLASYLGMNRRTLTRIRAKK